MSGIQEEMKGVIVALVTPFDHDGGVVAENLGPHINPMECELVQELYLEVVTPAPFEEQRLIRTGDFLAFD